MNQQDSKHNKLRPKQIIPVIYVRGHLGRPLRHRTSHNTPASKHKEL